MKALLRNPGETVTENDGIEGINWKTGAPLTNEAWYGGPYKLVSNYEPPDEDEPESYEIIEPEIEEAAPAPPEVDEPIVINGVAYTKEQLREMLGE